MSNPLSRAVPLCLALAACQGSVAEVGTHEDLIAHEGIYRTLWNVQTGSQVATS